MTTLEWSRLKEEERQKIIRRQESLPVRLSDLARDLGVRLVASTLPAGVSGEIRPNDMGGYVISINRHDSSRRQRFTVAHEIAHYLLHRDQIGKGITDDALYRSSLSDSREAEANRLAAEILMPRSAIATSRARIGSVEAGELVSKMADEFGVSEIAMKIRLGLD